MIFFINVFDSFKGQKAGVLEIYTENHAYEFTGKGVSDGGLFEFLVNSNKVECHLTSNIRKSKVAILSSPSWGTYITTTPPWTINTTGDGIYFGIDNSTTGIDWGVNKTT